MKKELLRDFKRVNDSLVRFMERKIFSKLYLDRNDDLKNTVIVAGTGRSGTTWLSEIIEKYLNYRIMFEPFHDKYVKELRNFKYKPYLRVDEKNKEFYMILNKILKGKIRNSWIDQINRSFMPKGRIIKTIRANYFLKWMKINFPEISIVYILRHPCAVVNSWKKLNWLSTDWDSLMDQKLLLKDHFTQFKHIFKNADNPIKKIACIWCAEQMVPLKSMKSEDLFITTYENLYQNPNTEVKKILNYLKCDEEINKFNTKKIISTTVRKNSAILKKQNPIKYWEKELSKKEIKQIIDVVYSFSLDTIYAYSFMPKTENIHKMLC